MKKNQQQDIDISDFIHTVELMISRFSISQSTHDFYSDHDNISFKLIRSPDRQYSHLKIVLPDIKKINIKSFEDVSNYLHNFFSKIANTSDRVKLLSAYRQDKIKVYSLHVFNRIYYEKDKDFLSLFYQIKNHSKLFALLFPHLESCDNRFDNSLYLNMTNRKNIIIYHEKEKRNLSAVKLEMRFNRSDNMKRLFKLDSSSAGGLSIRKVTGLSLPELMKTYNKYIDSFCRSLILKTYRKSLEESRAELAQIARPLAILNQEEEITMENLPNLYLEIIRNRKNTKKYLAGERKHRKGNLLLDYRSIDRRIKNIIMSKHREIFEKLYPEEVEELKGVTDYNFFRVQFPSYSYVLTFFDYSDRKKFKFITPSLVANLNAHRKECRVFTDLTPDDEETLKLLTLKKIAPAIKKIEKEYRLNKPKTRNGKSLTHGYYPLFDSNDSNDEEHLKDKFRNLVKIYLSHSPEQVHLIKDFQYFFNSFKFVI